MRRERACRTAASVMLSLALLATAFNIFGAESASPPSPSLENGALRIVFDGATGQWAEFTDIRNGHNFVGEALQTDLWQIDFSTPAGQTLLPAQAGQFTFRPSDKNPVNLELVWQEFGLEKAPEMRVVATVSLVDGEPSSLWSIQVEGLAGCRPQSVRYPRIPSIATQEDEVLAVPVWMGERITEPRNRLCSGQGRRFEWEYPGLLSLQCAAFYRDGGPGLYVACDDTAAFGRRFAFFGQPPAMAGFEMVQLVEGSEDNGGAYRSPYNVILGAFEGDWFTVAERYRTWGLKQPWAENGRLAKGDVADWLPKTGLWIWNRGRSPGVLDPAAALQERTGLPVSVFWHWWHGCAYDAGFPEYLPPREGAESFLKALQAAHERGLHTIVYMNQRLWGMSTRSWTEEGAERYAVKTPEGKVTPEVYNTFTKSPCASMCMGTPFWREKYAGLAERAVRELGVDGIYMDQACSSLACFDPTHGHPLGGGTYWMNGFRLLQADIRERCGSNGKVVLAGEGCGEAWLPYLDLMLSLQVSMERYAQPGEWEPIPFFHAVYHGRTIFYGNYSSLTMPPYDDLWPPETAPKEPLKLLDRKFSQQFRLEQARAFVWGQQPTVANFLPQHLEERAEEIDYVVRLAKLRYQALKYLLNGTMLRPPSIKAHEEQLDMSRLSIYAGQQGALREFQKTYPVVLASAWHAPDGDIAVVLVSIADTPQEFSIPLDKRVYSLPKAGNIFLLDDAGRRLVGEFKEEHVILQGELPPFGARVYELAGQ